jgi:hypothetical protein
LDLIRGLGGVNAIRREVPSYVILHLLPKLKVVKKDPKLHELLELLHVVDFLHNSGIIASGYENHRMDKHHG